MVDLSTLKQLFSLLKEHGASSFEGQLPDIGIFNVQFHVEQPPISAPLSTEDHTVHLPIDESSLPPDLRTDAITDYDKVMNWSGAPDDEKLPMPGLSDEPLYPQEHLPVDPP